LNKLKKIIGSGDLSLVPSYWTALSRRGCVGQLRNCFLRQELDQTQNQGFWDALQNDKEGSCVILQRLNEARSRNFGTTESKFIPMFAPCELKAYVACERAGPLATVVDLYQESTKEVRYIIYNF
jgi:hypothetical protein